MRRLLLSLLLVSGAFLWAWRAEPAPVVPILPTTRGGTGTGSMPACGAGAVLTRSGSTWSCTSSVTTASTLSGVLGTSLGGTGTSTLPVCSSGQAIGYDGGWGCIPASAGKAYLPLAANGVLTNSTATVVGGAWIDFSQYSTLTCRFEFSGSTTDTNAVLSAQLYDLTDLDGGTPLSVSSLATLKAVSGTLSLPQTGKQYEVRAWLADAGPTSTGNLLTAMIRCE